jgi:hypothetical protein
MATTWSDLENRDGVRFSFNCWPDDRQSASKCVVPLGALVTPLKPIAEVPVRVCGKLAVLRFVFNLSFSLSLSLVERHHRASSSFARASFDLFYPRDLSRARDREKKASGDLVEFWIQERTREKRTKIRASARALRCRIVASR